MVAYPKPNNGRKKKANGYEEREIRSSLFILDLRRWHVVSFRKSRRKQDFP